MSENHFEFNLYRLNIVDESQLSLFNELHPIISDEAIIDTLNETTNPAHDTEKETKNAHYRWGFRKFSFFEDNHIGKVVSLILARSIVEKHGEIVTDQGITQGFSTSSPPLADTMTMFFFMSRHLVAIERNGTLMSSKTWNHMCQKIFLRAATKFGYTSSIVLEPVPHNLELINLFKSFTRLTRLKINLRLPSPELSRYTRNLYEDLLDSGIREYLQDMKNPRGLSTEENARPFASVAMAQAGYKEGEVTLEGIKDGEFKKEITGEEAARGKISELKNFVRGVVIGLKTQEATTVVTAIFNEIERISPKNE